ncbi:hypothetical protein CC2G_009508 [Coprinopsis cinerea AmutBmut pab1-1]|nr:hypothetical protein CC2G_009508 [Coprinopsis cinerea AmutBmut pab1-1]
MGGYLFKEGEELKWLVLDPGRDVPVPSWRARMISLLIERRFIQGLDSEEEIEDRSKGDALAKTFVLVQVLWFIVQCIARYSQNLAMTELELTTLAYAILNSAMYLCWWSKPLDVQFPIVISEHTESCVTCSCSNGAAQPPRQVDTDTMVVLSHSELRHIRDPREEWKRPTDTHRHRRLVRVTIRLWREVRTFFAWCCLESTWGVKVNLSNWPPGLRHLILAFLYCIDTVTKGVWDVLEEVTVTDPKFSVNRTEAYPTFHAYVNWELQPSTVMLDSGVPVLAVAVLFGGLHCVAWSWTFSSPSSQLLWRIFALCITLSPLVTVMLSFPYAVSVAYKEWLDRNVETSGARGLIMKVLVHIGDGTILLSLVVYMISRIILLVVTFIELRYLPPSAHRTVEWSELIPHI